jgi:CelD/BcsL family acetyltransferase involved in cellulose biosynthesis
MGPAGQMIARMDRTGMPPARAHALSPGAVEYRVRRAAEAVGALAPEWTALAAFASEPNPFAEHWFVAASLATLGGEVRLIEVRRAGRLIGLLPVVSERGYGRIPVAFTQNWCHHQMFLGAPLVAAGEESAFWAVILEALDEADWAPAFFHVRMLVEDGPLHRGLAEAARALGRPCATVHRRLRALLASDLSPAAYYQRAVRQKKRKELRRLSHRLAELGAVESRILGDRADLAAWCDAFLAMEAGGWKGREGSALSCAPETEQFFRAATAAAFEVGKLQFRRLDVAGRPIAMLVNLLSPPGSFSFKTVFDEDYARFSPGVLIQIENLAILDRADIAWMDSCAMDDHPMIDGLWTERRSVIRATIPLKGARRRLIHAACRMLERASAALRRALGR